MTRNRHWRTIWAGVLSVAALHAAADEEGQIDFANGLFARGFYQDAAAEYRTYLEQYPDGTQLATAWYRLGESEVALENYAAALQAFEAIPKIPDSGYAERAQRRRGVVLYHLKRYGDATAALEEAAKTTDGAAESLYYLGKLAFDTGHPDQSIEYFSRMAGAAPGSSLLPYARYQMAFVYLDQGEDEKAAVQFSEVANAKDADESLRVECRFRAAETYDKLGWFEAAFKSYDRLRKTHPDSDYARRAVYGLAWSLYHGGRYPEATVAADQFLEAYPGSGRAPGMTYLLGNSYQQEKRYPEALEVYARVRRQSPDSDFAQRAHYRTASVLHLQGSDDKALNELDAYLRHEDRVGLRGDAAFLRGTILLDRAEFGDALNEFQGLVAHYSEGAFIPEARFHTGVCLAALGRYTEAIAAFDAFVVKHPGHTLEGQAQLRSGNASFALRGFDAAAARYSKLVSAQPAGPLQEEGLYRLGIAWHNVPRYAKSAEAFERLLAAYSEGPYAPEANLRVGDFHLRDGAEAMRSVPYFEAVLAREPDGTFAGRALEGLALARYESRDFDGAARSFLALIKEHGEVALNAQTCAWTGDYFFAKEAWPDASAAYEALLGKFPEYPQRQRTLFRLGEAAEASDDSRGAERWFASAAKVSPRSALGSDAQLRIAHLYEDRGDIDAAISLYEESASASTGESSAQARFRLAEIFETKGDYPLAGRHYMRVAILYLHETLSPESLLRAGRCFEKSGDKDQAMKTYREVLADYPKSTQAELARKLLGTD